MDQNVPKGAFTNKVSNLIFQIAMWCGFGQFSQRVEINRVNAKYLQLIALAPKTSESKCSKATNVVVSCKSRRQWASYKLTALCKHKLQKNEK